MSDVLLKTEDLSVGYRGAALLPPVNLTICSGERWAVIGPNGGGKTTCLRSLLGLLPAVSGKPQWAEGCRRSYVSQRALDIRSFPITVAGYVAGGIDRENSFLKPLLARSRSAQGDIQKALLQTQMTNLAKTRLGELSEGQYQRARIARALASNPNILILDEPTTGLDVNRQKELFELLSRLSDLGVASITVSHRMSSVRGSASHILLVDKECQVAVSGRAEEILGHPSYTSLYGHGEAT